MRKEKYTQVHVDKVAYTCGLTDQTVRITYTHSFAEGKAHTCWKSKFWFMVFGPWYFDPWYWSKVLIPGILSKVLVLSGFGPWY